MTRLVLPVLLLVSLAGCGPRRLVVSRVPPPAVVTLPEQTLTNRAEVSFVALGSVDAVLDAVVADLRAHDCLDVRRERDSTDTDVLVLSDPCPGSGSRAVLRVVDLGDGTVRGTVVALYSGASVGRPLALAPADALARQEVPVFVEPVPEFGQAACSAAEEWRTGLDAPPRLDVLQDTTLTEVEPVLIGGFDGFVRSVRYPDASRRAGLEGRTFVRFIVDETGAVTCAELLVSLSPDLDAEALRAVRAARFTPGTQDGRPVKVSFSVPMTFRLR